jgi:tetratricopeptide (TPR) repeat protein
MTKGAAESASRRGGANTRAARRIEAARGYLSLEMPDHALKELAGVRNPDRHRFDLSRLRGDALRLLGRFSDAAFAYTRALAERPDALPALMGVAACYRHLGQIDRAAAAMEEANRFHPNEPAVLFSLARLYVLGGEPDRALGWLGRAVRMCPEIAAWAERDDDFVSLSANPHFRLIVEAGLARQNA